MARQYKWLAASCTNLAETDVTGAYKLLFTVDLLVQQYKTDNFLCRTTNHHYDIKLGLDQVVP